MYSYSYIVDTYIFVKPNNHVIRKQISINNFNVAFHKWLDYVISLVLYLISFDFFATRKSSICIGENFDVDLSSGSNTNSLILLEDPVTDSS